MYVFHVIYKKQEGESNMEKQMYILKTESREEAEEICKAEPLVVGGYATFKLVGFQIANRENNYLL